MIAVFYNAYSGKIAACFFIVLMSANSNFKTLALVPPVVVSKCAL